MRNVQSIGHVNRWYGGPYHMYRYCHRRSLVACTLWVCSGAARVDRLRGESSTFPRSSGGGFRRTVVRFVRFRSYITTRIRFRACEVAQTPGIACVAWSPMVMCAFCRHLDAADFVMTFRAADGCDSWPLARNPAALNRGVTRAPKAKWSVYKRILASQGTAKTKARNGKRRAATKDLTWRRHRNH